jgi:Fe-S-cluster-containing hydrogenase component 2
VWEDHPNPLVSDQAAKLGLVEGQSLLLIDLDRCTRCDECVHACANTHDDGCSRLFLHGPRFGHYLIPTTCRSCVDPVCLIGCPVGSIHRGANLEILIEDWCIGCGLCAEQCPYGAIQMHNIGVIPEGSRGWRFLPASLVQGTKWLMPGFRDRSWACGTAPFYNGRNFRTALGNLLHQDFESSSPLAEQAVCFRFVFSLTADMLPTDARFKLELTASDSSATVWINGQELTTADQKPGKRGYWIPPRTEPLPPQPSRSEAPPRKSHLPSSPQDYFRLGKNVVAVRISLPSPGQEVLLDLRLDEIRKPEVTGESTDETTEVTVSRRAVVCDLCSSVPGQIPACVHACPHDAAHRVDARFHLPAQ